MKTNEILLYTEISSRITNTINYNISNCDILCIRLFAAASAPSDSRTKEDTTAGLSTRVPTTDVYVSTTSEAVKTSANTGSDDNAGR